MLALTDAALARLAIAATGIDPRRRRQWLREVAAKLDPASEARAPSPDARRRARVRQARWRARQPDGLSYYRFPLARDRLAEAMIASGRLSEDASRRRSEIERELRAVVEQWMDRWLEKP
ncbi:MAG TPA: hypothetical protein VKE42_07390 [Candidatus Cybelea sp.]|nr:hypothetical protein [Candidatus Cybelea sp.]